MNITPAPERTFFTPQPLTESQLAEFYREGYIVAEKLVPETTIDRIVSQAQRYERTEGRGWKPVFFDFVQPKRDANTSQKNLDKICV